MDTPDVKHSISDQNSSDSTIGSDELLIETYDGVHNEQKTVLAAGPLRLETIIRLRWGAIAGQSIAILVAGNTFGFTFPLLLCFVLIGSATWLNIFLTSRYERTSRLGENAAFSLFAFDTLQLGGLLFLTGGLINPFALLIMAPVVTSSATLSLRRTADLGGLAISIVTILAFFHLPLPWGGDTELVMPFTYVAGIWFAITISILFITFYVFRVAGEAETLSQALAATELVLQREHHLQALDGLAAAAAHELGTPLATIALVSKELDRTLEEGDPLKEDVVLLRSQSQRCRDILKKLSALPAEGDEHIRFVTPSTMLDEISTPLMETEVEIELGIHIDPTSGSEPTMMRNPGVFYGLGNVLENALDFAASKVTITTRWDENNVQIEIVDDGPGFSLENLTRFGEPYMTSRERRTGGGLGLGLFIAKTLLERSGAKVEVRNISEGVRPRLRRRTQFGASGACVSVIWPRAKFEDGLQQWKNRNFKQETPEI